MFMSQGYGCGIRSASVAEMEKPLPSDATTAAAVGNDVAP